MQSTPISDIYLVQVQYFLKAAEPGAFTKMASVLHVTQPTISKTIANLEKTLDLQLFIRRNKTLQLMPSGMHLYESWAVFMSQFESLVEQAYVFQREYTETLTIGSFELLHFEHLILQCPKRY